MPKQQPKPEMLVLGIMSGTSADGIDVALARISGAPPSLAVRLEGHHHVGFAKDIREAILRIANGAVTTSSEISQLNFLLGEELARAAIAACAKWRVPLSDLSLISSHGQTIYHQGLATRQTGMRRLASTLQIGEPSVIAQRTGVTTIADFRPADIGAAAKGAPLIPFVDYLLYRDSRLGRAALNIGGIANITVVPANAEPSDVFAFDTGPGNMVIDALVQHATSGKSGYDRGAKIALAGRTIPELLARLMREPYLREKPPKTAGREQFGLAYAQHILAWGERHHAEPADLVRTVTVFTSLSIGDAIRRFVLPRAPIQELIVAGGGARNPLIMAQLAAAVPGIELVASSKLGVPTEAKEAFAFAILGYEAYHQRPNNLPSATGAKRPAIMGKLVRGWIK